MNKSQITSTHERRTNTEFMLYIIGDENIDLITTLIRQIPLNVVQFKVDTLCTRDVPFITEKLKNYVDISKLNN